MPSHVPAADEQRGDRAHARIEPGVEAPLDAAHVGLGRRLVMRAGEQQGHVDRDAEKDRLLDRRDAFGCAGNLHEQVVAPGLGVDLPGGGDRAGAVRGQQRRDFHRDPAIDVAAGVEHRPEQVGSAAQVLQRQLDEQLLAGQTGQRLGMDRRVVGTVAADRGIEDARVGGQSGD